MLSTKRARRGWCLPRGGAASLSLAPLVYSARPKRPKRKFSRELFFRFYYLFRDSLEFHEGRSFTARATRARNDSTPLQFTRSEGERVGGWEREAVSGFFSPSGGTKSLVADAARFLTVLLVSRALSLRGE